MKAQKSKIFSRIKQWVKAHPRWTLIIVGVTLIALTAGAWWYAWVHTQPSEPAPIAAVEQPEEPPEPIYAPLTGVEIDDEATLTAPVTAVMIANSPEDRPQSGLADAEIVYEAIAEGGITRFMPIYQQNKPELIGPVRSLRTYYIDWLAPYDTSIAHVGGSANARNTITQYRTLDEFANPGSYWRVNDRWAPHNMYTNSERLDGLNAAKNYGSSEPQAFTRKDSEAVEDPNATQINVTMSAPLYNSNYTYNREQNRYTRSQGGQPHADRERGAIAPRVVVVMSADVATVQEDGLRERYQVTGSGQVHVFQDGTVTRGTWHKENRASQFEFRDEAGEAIALARGQTWISIVPNGRGGVTWQ